MKEKNLKRLWMGIALLVLLAPLGLLLPAAFNAGDAWGEWGPEEIIRRIGYLPRGMMKTAGLWKAPFTDYTLTGNSAGSNIKGSLEYIFSGLLGAGAVALLSYMLGRWLARKENGES